MKKPKARKAIPTEHQLIVELIRSVLGVGDIFAQSLANIHNLNIVNYNEAVEKLNKKLDECDKRFNPPKDLGEGVGK